MYVVKWKHVDARKWRDFVKPMKFKDLQKAQDYMKLEEAEQTGFYEFRIFQTKSKRLRKVV